MAHGKSFIPSCGPAYDRFFKNIVQYVALMCGGASPLWTHIPQAEITALSNAYAMWYTAWSATFKPHTKAETVAMLAAYKSSKKVLSRFIQVWFRGFPDIVTAEHLANMGIPPIDDTHTPIGKPETRPVFHIEVRDTRLLAVHFQDEGSASKARPYGMNGAVISLGVLDKPPAAPEDLKGRTELATRTPHLLHFAEEDRGKTVYVAMQWQNESGVRGEYTEVQSAIVP
jgi:hypothetical protein